MIGSGRPSLLVVLAAIATVCLALAHRDEIRARAEAALARGMPAREAALARGFVLGEDEDVDPATVEDFRRAGLSHLLAVSGQNVALLVLLATPILAGLGLPLRTRLVWVLGAIACYVPLAGAGPSIVRAGVMGGLSVLATLAGRRTSRLYALAVAAIVTLAVEPRVGADIGWQLSFAAVLGILLLATPLRGAIERRLGRGGWRRAFAEGIAITVAATLATAPLIAFHFEALSTTTLVANLLALPAVAPAMWLGMLAAGAGQVPGFPVGALNAIAAPLLAYIAQVAAWCGRPSWAYIHVRLGGLGLVGAYSALGTGAIAIPATARRCRIAALKRLQRQAPSPRNAFSTYKDQKTLRPKTRLLAAAFSVFALVWAMGWGERAPARLPNPGLRVEVLDVGQGDAILLQPAHAPALLVDGGPPGDDLAGKLAAAGVERLGVAVVTHEQSDHSGGIEELLGHLPITHLAYARASRRLLGEATDAGALPERLAEGDAIRSGGLRLEVLWPPLELLGSPLGSEDPNAQALVLRVRWRDFSMLLTADAEAELVPIESGPVDVLKVAHHGSADAGLGALLDRARPRLAVISVGPTIPMGTRRRRRSPRSPRTGCRPFAPTSTARSRSTRSGMGSRSSRADLDFSFLDQLSFVAQRIFDPVFGFSSGSLHLRGRLVDCRSGAIQSRTRAVSPGDRVHPGGRRPARSDQEHLDRTVRRRRGAWAGPRRLRRKSGMARPAQQPDPQAGPRGNCGSRRGSPWWIASGGRCRPRGCVPSRDRLPFTGGKRRASPFASRRRAPRGACSQGRVAVSRPDPGSIAPAGTGIPNPADRPRDRSGPGFDADPRPVLAGAGEKRGPRAR